MATREKAFYSHTLDNVYFGVGSFGADKGFTPLSVIPHGHIDIRYSFCIRSGWALLPHHHEHIGSGHHHASRHHRQRRWKRSSHVCGWRYCTVCMYVLWWWWMLFLTSSLLYALGIGLQNACTLEGSSIPMFMSTGKPSNTCI